MGNINYEFLEDFLTDNETFEKFLLSLIASVGLDDFEILDYLEFEENEQDL